MSDISLILASSSPRRRDLLGLTGLAFTTLEVGVDERTKPNESAQDYVSRLAAEKAEAALKTLNSDNHERCTQNPQGKVVILGSDTTVVAGDDILGKPTDLVDARRMLSLLSNRWHQVYTAVCLLINTPQGAQPARKLSAVVESEVKFRPLVDSEIQWYWQTGEPLDKAGAYAVQGIGGIFIERIKGSYSGIVGLPLCETVELLRRAGFSVGAVENE